MNGTPLRTQTPTSRLTITNGIVDLSGYSLACSIMDQNKAAKGVIRTTHSSKANQSTILTMSTRRLFYVVRQLP